MLCRAFSPCCRLISCWTQQSFAHARGSAAYRFLSRVPLVTIFGQKSRQVLFWCIYTQGSTFRKLNAHPGLCSVGLSALLGEWSGDSNSQLFNPSTLQLYDFTTSRLSNFAIRVPNKIFKVLSQGLKAALTYDLRLTTFYLFLRRSRHQLRVTIYLQFLPGIAYCMKICRPSSC